jgi:hypothetical protein
MYTTEHNHIVYIIEDDIIGLFKLSEPSKSETSTSAPKPPSDEQSKTPQEPSKPPAKLQSIHN